MKSRFSFLFVASIMTFLVVAQGVAQELDRTKRPGPQKVPTLQLPKIQKAQLKNGLQVWLVEHHELPMVSFNLVIQSGSERDPLDKPGLAAMTADVLDEGTKSRNALQIAEELEFIGANLSVRSSYDGSFVSLNSLTKHLDKALDVFADVLVNPTFPDKEFDRLKNERITSLIQQRDRAATIASIAFNFILYGNSHPYGNDPSGSEASLKSMTREDLVAFYQAHYRPNNATLLVVGDVNLKDITNRLEKSLAGWKTGTVPPYKLPATPAVDARRVYLIDKPGAPQSEIRIGYPALARSTPDFFAVSVANRALGGQFISRLNLNLREKHGFSYGVRSSFTFNKQPGPFVASGGVTTAKTDSSLQEFFYEIDRTHRDGITAEELEYVKKGMTGNFALTFETPGQIAGAMQNIVLYNLPENYYSTYLQNIDRVSLDDVKRVCRKYLDSSKMAVVVVGDLSVVREGVEKLNLGETVLCDVNGRKLTN